MSVHKRWLILPAIAVLMLALAACGAATSTTAPTAAVTERPTEAAPAAPPAGKTMTLKVVEHADTDTIGDAAPTGDSIGDTLGFANPVFDETNANQVGTDNGLCVRTVVGASWECIWTLNMEGGALTVEGPYYDTKDSVLAITGGSGNFAAASGQMTLHSRNDKGTEYDFTYAISLPAESDLNAPTALTVVEHADTDTVGDIAPKGDSVGDVLGFANPVFDKDNARQVGTDNGLCVRTAAGKTWECIWTLTLADGQLTVEGPFSDSGDTTLIITGGTGAYQNAHGTMGLHSRNEKGSEYDFSYQIVTVKGQETAQSHATKLVEHADTDTVADVDPSGDSVGDVLGFANKVFDEANTKEVGWDNGFCVRTAAGKAWECVWSTGLSDGQITVEGPFLDAGDSTLAITGGTDTVTGVRGQMTLHSRNEKGSEFDFGYEVLQ